MDTFDQLHKLVLELQERVTGENVSKHLQAVVKQLKAAEKTIKQYEKSWGSLTKTIALTNKGVAPFAKSQASLASHIAKTTAALAKQSAEAHRLNQNLKQAGQAGAAASRGSGMGLLSLRTLAATGAGYYAFRRFQELAQSSISASVLGGVGMGGMVGKNLPQGISATSAMQFMGKAIAENLPLQFRGNEKTTKALLAILEKTKVLGPAESGQLVGQFLKGFEGETDRLFTFLRTVNEKGPEKAIKWYTSAQNVQAASQLINALQLQGESAKGTLDPVTDAAIKLKDQFERLNESLDKVIIALTEKLLPVVEWFSKLSPTTQAGGAGLALALPYVAPVAGYALGRGRGGAGRAVGKGLRYVGTGLTGAGGAAMRFGRGLAGAAGRGLATLGTEAAGAAGLAVPAVAAPVAIGIGAAMIAESATRTAIAEKAALAGMEKTIYDDRLFREAERMKATAKTELQRLQARRMQLDAMLLGTVGGTTLDKDIIGRGLGFYGTAPEADQRQIDALRAERQKVAAKIQGLKGGAAPSSGGASLKIGEYLTGAVNKANEKLQAFGKAILAVAEKIQDANLEIQKMRALRLADLKMVETETMAQATVKGLEHHLATLSPFGPVGALKEAENYQASLLTAIDKQTQVLNLIDKSTAQGRIEALNQRSKILSTQIELKDNQKAYMSAMLDSMVAQAMGAGRFEKILITQDRNVAKGLGMGILTPSLPQFLGSVGPSAGRRPVRVITKSQNVSGAFENLKNVVQDIIPFLREMPTGLELVTERPTTPRGRAIL